MPNTTDKYHVRVTLFGIVTLENHLGRVVENPSRQARPWLLLKYLLAHREREVTMAELHAALPVDGGEAAYRVRLNRLREALAPLGLDGKSGLVQFGGGIYRLNPRYTLDTDVDRFLDLMAQIRACPVEDPAGLSLCKEALALYRSYQEMLHKGMMQYGEKCGPLNHKMPVNDEKYSWLCDPWPWEYAANKED